MGSKARKERRFDMNEKLGIMLTETIMGRSILNRPQLQNVPLECRICRSIAFN